MGGIMSGGGGYSASSSATSGDARGQSSSGNINFGAFSPRSGLDLPPWLLLGAAGLAAFLIAR